MVVTLMYTSSKWAISTQKETTDSIIASNINATRYCPHWASFMTMFVRIVKKNNLCVSAAKVLHKLGISINIFNRSMRTLKIISAIIATNYSQRSITGRHTRNQSWQREKSGLWKRKHESKKTNVRLKYTWVLSLRTQNIRETGQC